MSTVTLSQISDYGVCSIAPLSGLLYTGCLKRTRSTAFTGNGCLLHSSLPLRRSRVRPAGDIDSRGRGLSRAAAISLCRVTTADGRLLFAPSVREDACTSVSLRNFPSSCVGCIVNARMFSLGVSAIPLLPTPQFMLLESEQLLLDACTSYLVHQRIRNMLICQF